MKKVTYTHFIEKVQELGFVSMSKLADGFPAILDFVPEAQWWSGDPESDPWLWKDRAAEEKQLAFGSFFQGKKGFLSERYLPVFYYAFHPDKTIRQRWEDGLLGKYEWEVWNLLEQHQRGLGTDEIRKMLGVTMKTGGNSLNTAIVNLQLTLDLVISGNKDMLDRNGVPYNKANLYDKLENWVPHSWMQGEPLEQPEALERIYTRATELGGISREGLERIFRKQARLCCKQS